MDFMIVRTKGLKKYYRLGNNIVRALDGVDFVVKEREFVSIIGKSGSGKSTLLRMLGALDTPTAGEVYVDGRRLSDMNREQLAVFRRRRVGFIFQNYNLVPDLNVYENVVLPIELDGKRVDKKFVHGILELLKIEEKMEALPGMLSGGQQQRVAIARAVAARPSIILADEPTGALDSKSTDELLALFARINEMGQTILMVTHSVKAASRAGRVLFIKDGEVFHQVYRGVMSDEQLYQKISDTLTMLATGGERK
ncbi:MAG TPA: ABC transporter ATP-binding protein [Candidatus Mediterraneibacter cottocaccae]|nr:ABC transporter ATP-binding protein [Candidatus Mediterraneibacter cottocaccae]